MTAKFPVGTKTLAELAGDGLDGLDDIGVPADGVPRLRLLQPKGSGPGQAGTFQNSATLTCDAVIKKLYVLRFQRMRRNYVQGQGFAGESSMGCWSEDGTTPSPNVKLPIATTCNGCPDSNFNQQLMRTPCSELFATVVAVGADRRLFTLEFVGRSTKAFRNIVTVVKSRKLPLYGFSFDLSATQQATRNGDAYYSMVVTPIEMLKNEDVSDMVALAEKAKTVELFASSGTKKGGS